MLGSILNKVAGLQSCNFVKKTLQRTLVFSCEYFEIFKNRLFIDHFCWLLLTRIVASLKTLFVDCSKHILQIPANMC